MRILFAFICALALGIMGCSETSGTGGVGGDGGNGGVGGDGGNGGVVTDCTGVEDWTVCEPEMGPLGGCIDGVCFVTDCRSYEDGTGCLAGGDPSDLVPGLCVDGTCVVPVEDCSGEDNGTACGSGDTVDFCVQDQCSTLECSGREDGTYCVGGDLGDPLFGVCEAGECTAPEDCTGIADGVNCTGELGGRCEGGECV